DAGGTAAAVVRHLLNYLYGAGPVSSALVHRIVRVGDTCRDRIERAYGVAHRAVLTRLKISGGQGKVVLHAYDYGAGALLRHAKRGGVVNAGLHRVSALLKDALRRGEIAPIPLGQELRHVFHYYGVRRHA